MNIEFQRLLIHNFMSIGDADIDLSEQGYFLVKGVNQCSNDEALSNGSGKSSIFESLVWCLTGTTLRGSRNVKNMFSTEGTNVILVFTYNNDSFCIQRTREHSKFGNSLRIWKNDVEISGKGLRDSEKILQEQMPDFSPLLVKSVIVLGQGMPDKFTSCGPTGRKELLEKLCQSDFIISDIKRKIELRKGEVSLNLRQQEDKLLQVKTELKLVQSQLLEKQNKYSQLDSIQSYEEKLNNLKSESISMQTGLENYEKDRRNLDIAISEVQSRSELIRSKHDDTTSSFNKKLQDARLEFQHKESVFQTEIASLKQEIKKIESIQDICPLCKQKIVGVVKPSTESLENQLRDKNKEYQSFTLEKNKILEELHASLEEAKRYSNEEMEVFNDLQRMKQESDNLAVYIDRTKNQLFSAQVSIANLSSIIANHTDTVRDLQNDIHNLQSSSEELKSKCFETDKRINEYRKRLSVIQELDHIAKKQFRNRILQNIVAYLSSKCTQYSSQLFSNSTVKCELTDNTIEIGYSNKDYENLSGGEKQKVDIIVQFALRDTLCEYLGFTCSLLILDEVFDNLDSKSCRSVIDLVNAKLTDVYGIYIISHHAEELEIPVDKVITVIKNNEGISYLQ